MDQRRKRARWIAGLAAGVAFVWFLGARYGEPETSVSAPPPPPAKAAPLQPPGSAPGARLPGPGRFLVATRSLAGPFFAETVILLLEYSDQGAMGLVVNRPTPTLLGDLLPEVSRLSQRRDRVHVGGPVDPGLMTFLVRSSSPVEGAMAVAKHVYATGNPATLRAVIQSATPASHFHAFVGYSGWGAGQLDHELARGDWHVGEARAEAIFDDAPDDLWQRIVVEFEGIQVRAARQPRALALR